MNMYPPTLAMLRVSAVGGGHGVGMQPYPAGHRRGRRFGAASTPCISVDRLRAELCRGCVHSRDEADSIRVLDGGGRTGCHLCGKTGNDSVIGETAPQRRSSANRCD